LKVTDDGREAMRAAEPAALLVDARALDALPKAERAVFVPALRAIVAKLTPGLEVRRRPPSRRPRRRP
jgi:hypothetical protein